MSLDSGHGVVFVTHVEPMTDGKNLPSDSPPHITETRE